MTISRQRPSLSRFDLTVLVVLASCALALILLAWRSGSAANRVDELRSLYLTSDEQGRSHLFRIGLTEDGELTDPQRLSDERNGVWDFAVSPDGEQVIYSALSELGLSDLWTASLDTGERVQLLACPEASCSNARFAPDGRLIAYTQRNLSEFASAFFSPPRLWLMDLASGEMGTIFTDNQQLAFEPRWSADGQWLSYISPDPSGLGVIHLQEGRTALYPNAQGEPGVWSPTGTKLLTTNTWLQGEEYVTHLLQIDVETNEVIDLSGVEALVSDSGPEYSPNGEWIAFRRKVLTGPQSTRGKQIWLMRADGSDAEPFTADEDVDYGNPVWSPDGRYLLTRRFPLKGPEIIPSIWLIDTESGDVRQLIQPGDQPMWVP
jgi:Tol biopolymer transport system component